MTTCGARSRDGLPIQYLRRGQRDETRAGSVASAAAPRRTVRARPYCDAAGLIPMAAGYAA